MRNVHFSKIFAHLWHHKISQTHATGHKKSIVFSYRKGFRCDKQINPSNIKKGKSQK